MSENDTLEAIVDEDGDFLAEEMTMTTKAHRSIWFYIGLYYFPILIVIGVSCSILVLTILIRRRLWIRHEVYIFLAAILIVNSYELIFIYSNMWLYALDHGLLRLPITAEITCKLWIWLSTMIHYIDWLYVLMLLNVYLHQKLITSSNRCRFGANLAAKYCSLFGTKVIIGSYFIVCALSTFWTISMAGLIGYGSFRHCHEAASARNFLQMDRLMKVARWFKVYVPLFIEAVLLLLIVCKRWRSSCIVFSQLNGSSQDNGDAEGVTRLVAWCAVAVFVNSVPQLLVQFLSITGLGHHINTNVSFILHNAYLLMNSVHSVSTPIVCFVVKSIFRDDMKAMVQRCCRRCFPGSRCNREIPAERDNNGSSVLQMDSIDEDSTVTRREEDSD